MDSFRAWPPHTYIFEFGMLQSKGLFLWFEKNLKMWSAAKDFLPTFYKNLCCKHEPAHIYL